MAPARLICAGSLTVDNVVTADGHLLPPMFGGNVVYAGLGARLWHDRVSVLSRAGSDYSDDYLDLLKQAGLDISGIARVSKPHGMNVAFRYQPDGTRTRRFTEDMLQAIPPHERARMIDYSAFDQGHRYRVWTDFAPTAADLPRDWDDVAGVHCAAMPVESHLSLAAHFFASQGRTRVQVDSPWYDERDLTIDHAAQLLPLIDALLPSESDLITAGPGDELARLGRFGGLVVVVKRGGRGSEIRWPDGRRLTVPVVDDLEIVDFTGAGDAFCGGFLAGMYLTGNPVTAALHGTVSASFAIEAAGIDALISPSRKLARDRLDRLTRLLSTTTA